jgi:hypothetical protein
MVSHLTQTVLGKSDEDRMGDASRPTTGTWTRSQPSTGRTAVRYAIPGLSLGSWLETGFEEMTQGFGSIAQGLQKATLTIVGLAFQHFNSFSSHMKRRLKAENVSAQEFISEFASRVVFLAELNEVG